MIDAKTLDYRFDEETMQFGAPPTLQRGKSANAAGAAIGLGALVLLIAAFAETKSFLWILGSFGLMTAGALWLWQIQYRGTTPGIKSDGLMFRSITNRGAIGYALAIFITGFYIILYFSGSAPFGIPVPEVALLGQAAAVLDPLAHALSGGSASKWFLYGFLYTLCVFVFGVRMYWKYRHNRYQIIRTTSVILVQLILGFLVPMLLKAASQPEQYLSYFWPLKPDYLYPQAFSKWAADPMSLAMFFLYWGALLTFVGTPILTYFYGKRWYCSWVCGCGGLAETLGDPWRQLSAKSTRAWHIERWMIHSVLVVITLLTAWIWIDWADDHTLTGASEAGLGLYGLVIGSMFSGVIGVGFYPIMGARVWCRFGCPMAAILGLLQRYASRFRITTNGGQCMSCGNCSTACEMGIDVKAYAQRGQNIVRASCVGCGICSAVCPRGVLKLENGSTKSDRYPGAEKGFGQLQEDLRGPKLPI